MRVGKFSCNTEERPVSLHCPLLDFFPVGLISSQKKPYLPALMLVAPDQGPQELGWRTLRPAPPELPAMDSGAVPRSLWREEKARRPPLLPSLAAAACSSLCIPSSSELQEEMTRSSHSCFWGQGWYTGLRQWNPVVVGGKTTSRHFLGSCEGVRDRSLVCLTIGEDHVIFTMEAWQP